MTVDFHNPRFNNLYKNAQCVLDMVFSGFKPAVVRAMRENIKIVVDHKFTNVSEKHYFSTCVYQYNRTEINGTDKREYLTDSSVDFSIIDSNTGEIINAIYIRYDLQNYKLMIAQIFDFNKTNGNFRLELDMRDFERKAVIEMMKYAGYLGVKNCSKHCITFGAVTYENYESFGHSLNKISEKNDGSTNP